MKGKRMVILLTMLFLTIIVMNQPVVASQKAGSEQLAVPITSAGGQWAMRYEESEAEHSFSSIHETNDGGFIAAGHIRHDLEDEYKTWVVKLNSNGTIAWQKEYAVYMPTLGFIIPMELTSDGGYIIAGANADYTSVQVLKLNSDGTIAWQKNYDGTVGFPESLQETSDGGFVMAGWGEVGFWVLKLDDEGSMTWQRTYDSGKPEWATSIRSTSDGGYILAGSTDFSLSPESDFWILKLNSDGTIVWQKTYGGTAADFAQDIQETNDGGYIVIGDTNSFGASRSDVWVLKLNHDGTIAWQKVYGYVGDEYARAIQETSDGGYIVAARNGWKGWILKLDDDGTVAWQRTYDVGNQGIRSIQETNDGGYIAAGFDGISYYASLLKLDSEGQITNCDLVGETNLFVSNTSVVGMDSNAAVQSLPVMANDINTASEEAAAENIVLCSAPGGCTLNMDVNYNGAQLALGFDLYTGPENVTWGTSLNVMGNWFPLWQTPLPADTSYQNTISLPLPHFGNVAVFTALVAPPNGIVCADYELVDTGASATHGEMPPINKLPRESLGLPPDE